MRKKFFMIGSAMIFLVLACSSKNDVPRKEKFPENFGSYWFRGEAEITSYNLKQARYGEIHKGTAITIFVTEDFSRSKQVKLDDPAENPDDAVKVLKLNMTKKFNTGVYPYSMMKSVFTPVDLDLYPGSLKVTATSQEWCGQTYTQFNLVDEENYRLRLFSYFESEGDQDRQVDHAWLEDEIWNIIRINPEKLPVGQTEMIPGSLFQRFAHLHFKPEKVQATREDDMDDARNKVYSIRYQSIDRVLTIVYKKSFPHQIVSWTEKYKGLTTTAKQDKTILLDYWNKNSREDQHYRDSLLLDN